MQKPILQETIELFCEKNRSKKHQIFEKLDHLVKTLSGLCTLIMCHHRALECSQF